MADDIIDSLDETSGKVQWSASLQDEVAGPPLLRGDLVCLSGETAIVGLRKKTGTRTFRTPYSPAFRATGPSTAALLGTPDQMVVRGSNLVVWRERAGLTVQVRRLPDAGTDPDRKETIFGKKTLLEVAKDIDKKLAKLLVKHGARR